MSYNSFEELEVYKVCRAFRQEISNLMQTNIPAEERFMLKTQIIKSSRSVTAQIAEGFGRFHFQENIQFCRIARGSLTETLDHLLVAFDENYIDQHTLDKMRVHYMQCLKLLNGYISYLKSQKKETY